LNHIIHIVGRLDSPENNFELGTLVVLGNLHFLQKLLYNCYYPKDRDLLFLADTAKMALVFVIRKMVSENS
jgi:hypothetical protein